MRPAAETSLTFTILFDNIPYEDGYRTSGGYACLIQGLDRTILFDVGGDGQILLDNLTKTGVDAKDIDAVVISHDHWDHTRGLSGFLAEHAEVEVFLLDSFSEETKDIVRSNGATLREVSGSFSVGEGVYSTGRLGFEIPEQSLVVEQDEGLILVTGCAHPGLRGIVEKAREITNPKPVFIVGGFHLRDDSKAEVTDLMENLDALGVQAMAPSHCTGGAQRHTIKKLLGDRCLDAGAGRVITMEEIRKALR